MATLERQRKKRDRWTPRQPRCWGSEGSLLLSPTRKELSVFDTFFREKKHENSFKERFFSSGASGSKNGYKYGNDPSRWFETYRVTMLRSRNSWKCYTHLTFQMAIRYGTRPDTRPSDASPALSPHSPRLLSPPPSSPPSLLPSSLPITSLCHAQSLAASIVE